MFVIEDEWHAELEEGEYMTLESAIDELRRRSEIPWDEQPNQAPCISWRTCGRSFVVLEYDGSMKPWRELRRHTVLEVTAKGVKWMPGLSQ